MSLTQFLSILLARRWIIGAAVLASLLGASLVVALLPPRYEASTRVIMDIIKADPVTGEILPTQFVRAFTTTQTELIKDYKVAGRVADDLGWTTSPEMLERFEVPGNPDATRREIAQTIIDGTDAKLIEGSNILEIKFTGPSPDAAKAVADAIRRAYLDVTLSFKRQSAGESADWYQVQVDNARRLLAIAEAHKGQFERQNGLIMQADKTDVDSARLAALSQQGEATVSGGMPMISGPSSTSLELAKVEAALGQARRSLGPNHPTVVALQQQRGVLASQVGQERAASRSAGSAASMAASAPGAASRRALEAQRSKVISKREDIAKLRQLQDDVDLRREQFQKAAAKAADLRLQANVADAGMTVLGGAVAPERPSFPNVPLILAGALAFGAALGLLAALLTELLSRRVRTSRDLIHAAGDVPMLAVIANADAPASNWASRLYARRRRASEAPEPAEALAA